MMISPLGKVHDHVYPILALEGYNVYVGIYQAWIEGSGGVGVVPQGTRLLRGPAIVFLLEICLGGRHDSICPGSRPSIVRA